MSQKETTKTTIAESMLNFTEMLSDTAKAIALLNKHTQRVDDETQALLVAAINRFIGQAMTGLRSDGSILGMTVASCSILPSTDGLHMMKDFAESWSAGQKAILNAIDSLPRNSA